MRIFKFTHDDGEIDIVAATKILEAASILCTINDIDITDIETSDVEEIKKSEWDDIYFSKEDGQEFALITTLDGKTLLDWISENDNPGYIAGT